MKNLFDHREQNKQIHKSLQNSIENIFPIESGDRVLELRNVRIQDDLSETDFPAQRETKLNRKT